MDYVMMHSELYSDLIGKPYMEFGTGPEAYDCFGLAQEIHRRLGNPLPPLLYSFGNENIAAAVETQRGVYIRLTTPEVGCIITFRMHPKYINHVGIALDHCRMIHAVEGRGVVIARYDSVWLKPKIEGFYLWKN